MHKSDNTYDRSVRSLNNSDSYEFSGESEYSRERSDPYQMVDYMIDRGLDFREKTPKGFSFSDDKVREDVSEVLARDSKIDVSELIVEVKDGVVVLKGHVDSRQSKRMAELIIENLPGVVDVINQLHFK